MEKCKTEEVGKNCLIKARNYAQAENWTRAFPHYLMCLEIFPNNRNRYKKEFTEVLYQLGIWLELRNEFSEVVKWYTIGLKYFPECARMLNYFGEFFLRTEQSEEALVYLKSACMLDRGYLLAEKNLVTAKLNVIPRWHYRMLNDRLRNEAYRFAIHKAITHNYNRILDIGAGCGLLSFYASECQNTKRIIALESSSMFHKIATDALKGCNVTVINKYSTSLNSSDIGLSNVLITEIFDAGLFGECALETLIHAWDNLLEPSAIIIPNGADLFVTGISSDTVLHQHKLQQVTTQLGLQNVCVTQITTEPYEAEDLKQKKVQYITNTEKVVHVNFSNVEQLKQIFTESNSIPVFTLNCVKSGTIDAFVIWFDLHLNNEITITTNPLQNSVTCWEQAVIYLDHPVVLQKGDSINLQLSCASSKLEIKILNHVPTCDHCFKVSADIITFLNDVQITETASNLELSESYKESNSSILDLNPFPLFALCLAKKGYPGRYKFILRCQHDWEFLNYVWCLNGFSSFDSNPESRINFEIYQSSQIENHLTQQSFDVIFVNPISKNGTLCEEMFQRLPKLQSALRTNGLILPSSVKLQVEIIDSKYLNFCNKVQDENLCGFIVANQINNYAVLEQWQIEPQYYQREVLGRFTGLRLNLLNNCDSCVTTNTVRMLKSGIANGFLYWYTLEYLMGVYINTDSSFHYRNACCILKQSQKVNASDILKINIRYEQGLLKIYCEEDENDNV